MHKKTLSRRWLLSSALALAGWGVLHTGANAQARELAGARFEPAVNIAGSRLVLNGAGIRYKAIFKVYAAGLYAGTKANTLAAITAQSGPKRMHIVMLRDIDANELGRLFTRGIEENTTRAEFVALVPGTIKMSEIFSSRRKLSTGEYFDADWLPGTGLVVSVNGKPVGEPIKEPEFYNALLRIWLGQVPADFMLKDALLGIQASSSGTN
ncbi:MAG: hypothetical protein RJA98_1738 [Pseudomonadota bacterium]|jgi:hypothetical protein